MTDTFRVLCAEVLAFNNGESPYNFSGLNPYDRDNAAFDAWQDIRQRLKSALRRARPEPEGPTDEPLGDLIDKWVQEAFRKKPYGCKHPTHTYVACKAFEHGRNHPAHAALAQPEPEEPHG